MSPDESSLLALAEAVADGAAVDWDHWESTATDDVERSAVAHMRLLARVAAASQPASWGPLQIRSELGSGSFGTVYRAWDPRLDWEVALKLFRLDASVSPTSATVIGEGRLLARVTHPNIVAVHGAGVYEGRVGIWMEFVSGRTLKQVVEREGPYGAQEAALIGRDLCQALAAVHVRGFVHGDVKAQNVMRAAGGRTVLMDFGASSVVGSDASRGLRGTPAYLAPELLMGSPPTTSSDLYGLGVLLYFLVSGTFPVTAESLDDLKSAHAGRARTLLRDVRPDLPADFVRVVDAATSPDPAERPASAGAFEMAIERSLLRSNDGQPRIDGEPDKPSGAGLLARRTVVIATSLILLIGMLTASWWYSQSSGRRDSVAILPFRNLAGTDQDDYLTEGLTGDLIANMAVLPNVRVIAGGSVRAYAARSKSFKTMGDELGVGTILDATLRRSGNQVRIVAQLIDTKTEVPLWSDKFDSTLDDLVSMKSDVAMRIAVALRGELSERDRELLRPGRKYDAATTVAYLKGRHYVSLRTADGIQTGITYLQEAIRLDSKCAPGFAGLADAYTMMGAYGFGSRSDAFRRAGEAAAQAVALDASLAEAHAALGYSQKNRFEWQSAEESFKQAIALRPGYDAAHQWYSILLTQLRRQGEAQHEAQLALNLNPLSLGPQLQMGSYLLMFRRPDAALKQYESALLMDATNPNIYRYIGQAYTYSEDFDNAMKSFKLAGDRFAPAADDQELKADLAFAYASNNRPAEARRILKALTERYERGGESAAGNIAAVYAGLREADQALLWLERARKVLDPEVGYLAVDPRWDSLRADQRFKSLLKTLGLPDSQ